MIKGLCVIGVMFPIGGACSLVERKVSAWMQGPSRPEPGAANYSVRPTTAHLGNLCRGYRQPSSARRTVSCIKLGVFHLMADGLKMFFKEDSLPGHVNKFYFLLAPVVGMIPALTTVTVVPFGAYIQ